MRVCYTVDASEEKMGSCQGDAGVTKAKGTAAILAIATANPPNCFDQALYPDYYFRVTGCDHMTEFKEKFKHLCENSTIERRFLHLNEDILKANPILCSHRPPSLKVRQNILNDQVPKLGARAASKAIDEWARPRSEITHLIFCSMQGLELPGADVRLVRLLGLDRSVKRVMLYHHGCHVSLTALRMAKDFAENDAKARVLVVVSESSVGSFRGPCEDDPDNLQMQGVLGDAAAAVIVGADAGPSERPIFYIMSSAQTIVPDSEDAIRAFVHEDGFTGTNTSNIATLMAGGVPGCVSAAFKNGGLPAPGWNSLFWAVQGTVKPVLDSVEVELGLGAEKLRASRKVLKEYGYVMAASSVFVLDEVRRRSAEEGKETSGYGLEFGVMVGFGAGVTVEVLVLRGLPS